LYQTNITLKNFLKKINSKKAIAPVISTLLLIAIAVVGASLIFSFSQQFSNSAQATGLLEIESILFLGYDATDSDSLKYHDDIISNPVDNWHGNQTSDGLKKGERIAIYVQNNSVEEVSFREVRLSGSEYMFTEMSPNYKMTSFSDSLLKNKEYTIVINGNQNAPADTIVDKFPTLQPGQHATIILELDNNTSIGRDMQFRLTTTQGGVFVYTVEVGQSSA